MTSLLTMRCTHQQRPARRAKKHDVEQHEQAVLDGVIVLIEVLLQRRRSVLLREEHAQLDDPLRLAGPPGCDDSMRNRRLWRWSGLTAIARSLQLGPDRFGGSFRGRSTTRGLGTPPCPQEAVIVSRGAD